MDIVSLFVDYLSPDTLYQAGESLTRFIAVAITPVLLVIAIAIRTLETSIAGLTGQNKWGLALKDIALWTVVLGLYFGLTNMVIELFNALYTAFADQGSMAKLFRDMETLFKGLNDQAPEGEMLDLFSVTAPAVLVTFLIYYATLVLLAFVTIFMQLAHAIGYSLVVAWGMIAIPLSITASLKILKGWATLLGILLVWPIIHYIIFAFLDPMIQNASSNLLSSDLSDGLTRSALYMLFSIINLILIVAAIAAPFVAMPLINGSGSITGLVTPFVGGAMAATGAVMAGTRAATIMGGKRGMGAIQRSGQPNGILSQAARSLHDSLFPGQNARQNASPFKPTPSPASNTSAKQTTATPNNTPKTTKRAAQAVAGSAMAHSHAASTDSDTSAASNTATNNTHTTSNADSKRAKRQTRRGAILNQMHNKGKIKLKGRKK